ncbi:MAG: hypothetical protein WA673_17130, partial [Candidatus Acidiferrales bacterium]
MKIKVGNWIGELNQEQLDAGRAKASSPCKSGRQALAKGLFCRLDGPICSRPPCAIAAPPYRWSNIALE